MPPIPSALRRLLAAALLLGPPLAAADEAAAPACGAAQADCAISGPWGEGVYRLALPEGEGPFPVVLSLHGWGGRAAAAIAHPRRAAPFLARGYAVLAPQGMPRRPGDRGGSWNAMADPGRRDDIAFLRAALDDAAARAPLDRARTLAAGFSGGGMMIWRLACDAPGTAAAYAPLSGLLWRPLPKACAGPARLLHAHGWRDAVVPLEGRAVAGGRLVQGDLFRGLALMRRAAGCAADAPDAHAARGPFLVRRWTRCAEGAELAFALFPGGHRAPEGWAALVLDWFEGAPLDAAPE